MKKNLFLITLITLFVFIFSSTVMYAIDHTSCYDLIWFYGGWGYNGSLEVIINYTYTQNGTRDYTYRISQGADEWSSEFNFFKFTKVTSNGNCKITSDDYLDNGWVGIAYYTRSPKEIKLNQWYHDNYSNYGYVEYERTVIHEFGHLHGLNHVDCVDEIMSNNPNRNISQTYLGEGDKAGIRDKY